MGPVSHVRRSSRDRGAVTRAGIIPRMRARSSRLTTSSLGLTLALLSGCAAQSRGAPAQRCSEPAALAPAPTAAPVATAAPGLPALMAFEPAEDTLPAVREQFGQLVGAWRCRGEARQPDGSFKPSPGESRWTFFYTLGAQAIGDVFEPAASGAAVGINLRVYDPERELWVLAWTTPALRRYEQFEARREGDTIVMRGDIPAKGPFPDHRARITFFDMTPRGFEWRYEAAAPGTDGPWQEFSRIHCVAAGA